MEATRPLNVDVRVYAQGRGFVVEVEDDGRGLAAGRSAALPQGHGLANVAERLRLCFGDAGLLTLAPRAGGGTLARISIGG